MGGKGSGRNASNGSKGKKNGQPSSTSDEVEEDRDLQAPVALGQLEKVMEEHFAKLNLDVSNTVLKLEARLEAVEKIAANALKLAEKLEAELAKEKSANAVLKKTVEMVPKLEEKLEERTNRQLRKTLVFKGIPSKYANSSTPNKKETWQETEEIVRQHISEVTGMEYDDTDGFIERCHRSAPNPKYLGSSPQPIFAAIYDWKDCERLTEAFRKNNIQKRSKVQCDYKYGPKTTRRRNMALNERKTLKSQGKIVSGYVAYPAKLMVKLQGEQDYKLHKDFSKAEIVW